MDTFEEQQKRYEQRMEEWRKSERKRRLALAPHIKKKLTKKLINSYIDFCVYDALANSDVLGAYRASGQSRMAGGLKRSIQSRSKRFFSEYKRIFGEPFDDQTTYRAVCAYLDEKYEKDIEKNYNKEHKRRFGW